MAAGSRLKSSELIAEFIKVYSPKTRIEARLAVPLGRAHVTVVFGPSGSGKTTLLRCLAGLEAISSGRIVFGNEVWEDTTSGPRITPQARQVGFLHQDYALFPHLSVTQNVGFSLHRLPASERERQVTEMLEKLDIHDLGERRPAEISGGQQQRVALARALVRKPRLLLLDEPFAAVDVPTRQKLQFVLKDLVSALEVPAIVVTHDWVQALSLAQQLVILSGGRILQAGDPEEIFLRPSGLEVAAAAGVETVVRAHEKARRQGLLELSVANVTLRAVDVGAPAGSHYFACIRAGDVTLELGPPIESSARNHLQGRIREIVPTGNVYRIELDVGFPLAALVTRSALQDLDLRAGKRVQAAIKASCVHLIPAAVKSARSQEDLG